MDNLMREEAARLFHDYTIYWHQTARVKTMKEAHPVKQHKLTDKRLKLFLDVVQWCKDQQYDPRVWLFCLFESRRWTFAPQLEPGHLMSKNERIHKRYERLVARNYLDGYQRYIEGQRPERPERRYDPNRDLSNSVEARKAKLLQRGDAEACMAQTVTDTFGFHPGSQYCVRCPINERCKQRLQGMVNFDIIALREGRITSAQAKVESRKNG